MPRGVASPPDDVRGQALDGGIRATWRKGDDNGARVTKFTVQAVKHVVGGTGAVAVTETVSADQTRCDLRHLENGYP